MENFNYDDRKYLTLNKIDTKKVQEIYKDYEVIIYSIDGNKLLMNGVKVAKVTNLDSKTIIKDLNGTINFDDDIILTVSYTE